ncbi:MAG TPA: globin [Bryobacteraceae bacterium]|nr:globin [Bryobacteraceae bacterium]
MDPKEVARVFNDSYDRVMKTPAEKGEFFNAFYALLITSSAEAAKKFANTDFEKQVQMLRASVAVLVSFYGGGQDDYLQKLAERHSRRGVDIPPALYSIWLDCLIETVGWFDPKFSNGVAAAWREVFSKGIEYMTSQYGSS